MLNEIIKNLQKRGIEVYLCEANPQVRRHMYRAGLFRTLGRKHLWRKFSKNTSGANSLLRLKNVKMI